MRRNIFGVIVLVLSTTIFSGALISCGSGGGGGGGGGSATLAAGTFTKNVFYAGGISAEDQFSTSPGSRYQSLYLARDLTGAGRITSISYKYGFNNVVTAVSCPNVTIKMGHTQVNTLSGTFANNVENGMGCLKTVINNSPVTIPPGSTGSYYTINLATPFYYNGVDNLVVEVSRGAACTSEVGTVANISNPVYNAILRSNQSPTAPTGTANNVVLDTVFTFSGGDNFVDYDGALGYNAPFTTNAVWRHVQSLHPAADIRGSGPITGIGMVVNAVTSAGTYTVTIKLGHSTLSALTTTYASNFSDIPVTVANALTFTVPAGVPAGNMVWLPFTSSFNYNGSDNLIVDIDVVGGSADQYWQCSIGTAGRTVCGASGSSRGIVDQGALSTKFRFHGATMDVVGSNDGPGNVGVFGIGAGSIQFLLHASELGTAGSIDKFACRLTTQSLPSIAVTFQNVTVTLAHTSQGALAAPYASNIAGGTKVYDGPFAMPEGLLGGDWVEIPFTTAFSYDGTRNLVVQTTTAGGPQPYTCQISLDVTRFTDRYMDTMGGPWDLRGNFRFWISK